MQPVGWCGGGNCVFTLANATAAAQQMAAAQQSAVLAAQAVSEQGLHQCVCTEGWRKSLMQLQPDEEQTAQCLVSVPALRDVCVAWLAASALVTLVLLRAVRSGVNVNAASVQVVPCLVNMAIAGVWLEIINQGPDATLGHGGTAVVSSLATGCVASFSYFSMQLACDKYLRAVRASTRKVQGL